MKSVSFLKQFKIISIFVTSLFLLFSAQQSLADLHCQMMSDPTSPYGQEMCWEDEYQADEIVVDGYWPETTYTAAYEPGGEWAWQSAYGSNDSGGGGGGEVERPPMPRPPYCSTLELDLAKCAEDAQTAYNRGVQDCSSSRWTGGILGVIAGGIVVLYTGGTVLVVGGAIGGGGLGGAEVGNYWTSDCQSDWQNWKDGRNATCNVDFQSKKQTCAQF